MSHKSKQRTAKKIARLEAGQIMSGIKPSSTREEVAQLLMRHLDARILDIRKLLIQADRILARHRCQGMVAGLSGK